MEGDDVTDPDVLEAVETAVRRSMSVKRIKIEESYLRWTNVTTAILKGAAQSKPLREVKLVTPWNSPSLQEVVDDVRKANPKLQLVVRRGGKSALHDLVVLSLVSSCCIGGETPPHLTGISFTNTPSGTSVWWCGFALYPFAHMGKEGLVPA